MIGKTILPELNTGIPRLSLEEWVYVYFRKTMNHEMNHLSILALAARKLRTKFTPHL
jgi:hypothetical protein